MSKREAGVAGYDVAPCMRCGAEVEIRYYYSDSAKKRRAKGKSALCRECWKKKKNAEASEYGRRRGYAVLKGTPGQIAWAESIRYENITRAVKDLEKQGAVEFAKRTEAWLGAQQAAKFWIEYRDYSAIEDLIQAKINEVLNAEQGERYECRAG